jgi:hypothetical protein
MHSTWYSLAWKEWHEHKWKLAAIAATMCGVLLCAVAFYEHHDFPGVVSSTCWVCAIPLSLFIGFGAGANERSRRSLPFLQSLPAPLWQIAILKLFFGMLMVFIPILLMATIAYAEMRIAPTWEPRALESLALCLPFAASLFIWSAAIGVNRKDEVSAAAVSLSVMVGWSLILLLIAILCWSPNQPPAWFLIASYSATPGGIALLFSSNDMMQYQTVGILLWLPIHGLLCAWYIARFGHTTHREIRSPSVAAEAGKAAWLPPPRRTALSATAWKQFRESGPIVLCGLAGAVAITTIIMMGSFYGRRDTAVFADSGDVYTKVALVVSFFIALVLGIGVCHADIEPQLNTFWRTRPINPDGWFWIKFATGLTLLLAATYLPNTTLAFLGVAKISADMTANPYLLASAQIAIFASAVAITCLVRHAVYAAILTIPVIYLGVVMIWVAMWAAAHLGGQNDWAKNPLELTETQLAWGFLLTFFFSTLLAWLAMRNDWGRKSRY